MVKNYNDKVHSTIKMTPKEATKDINRGKVYFNIIRKQNKSRTSIKYKKGDNVRISKYKIHFEKEYTVAAPIFLSTKTFEKRYENGS